MLTTQEENFINYWQLKRQQNKLNPFFFAKGFSAALFVVVLIFIATISGWYKRADYEIGSKLHIASFAIASVLIVVFITLLYNFFKYEQNEQLYNELLAKKQRGLESEKGK